MNNIRATTTILTPRTFILAGASALITGIFVWQGVDSMVNQVADYQGTFARFSIFIVLFLAGALYLLFLWFSSIANKMEMAIEFTNNADKLALQFVLEESEPIFKEYQSKYEQTYESLEWERRKLAMQTAKMRMEKEGEIAIPSDYSTEKRNRIVFVQQKGANGQTAYEYAYYEVLNNKLIIGKANFKRKLYSTSDKKDSLNRMIGIEDVYTSDNITVCRLFEIDLNLIPHPYNIAVQLGCLKTDTVLRLAKEWTTPKSEETIELPNE